MEYAGYIKRKPTDWSKIARETTERLGAIEEGREKKREELDTLYKDTQKAIREVELGQNETKNQAILKSAQEARDGIYSDYKKLRAGEISPGQFRSLNNNRQDSWGELNTAMKQYNARYAKVKEMVDDGTASDSMIYDNERIALRMGNDGYQWMWGDDGTLVSAQVDANGKIVDGTILPVSSLNKTQNVLSKRFNLEKAVGLDKIGKFKQVVKGMRVEGYDAIPKIDEFNASVTTGILTSDDIIGKVLTDASTDPYFYYTTDKELADKLAADKTLKKEWGVKKELGRDGGMVAAPTDTQKDAAEKVITDWIKYKIGSQETPIKKDKPKPKPYSLTKKEKSYVDAYELTHKIAGGDENTLDTLIDTDIKAGTIASYKVYPDRVVLTMKPKYQQPKGEEITIDKNNPEEAFKHVYKYEDAADLKTGWDYGKAQFGGKEETIEIVEGRRTDMSPAALFSESDDIENKEDYSIIKELLTSNTTSSEDSRKKMSDYVKDHISKKVKMLGGGGVSPNDIKVTFSNNNQDVTIQVGDGEPQIVPAKITGMGLSKEPDIKSFGDAIVNAINSYKDKYNESLKAGGTTKKTVAQLTKDNPKTATESVAEYNARILQLYNNQ